MNLAEIIKSQEFFKNLIQKKQEGTISNALMFLCEDEYTSKPALILSALMLQYKTFELFNENSAEFKKLEQGTDLDIKVYPKNQLKLLVGDSNEIVSEAYIKPVNLPYKIFIIHNIDKSTDEAQNKLLKVLEEPPQNVYFLLSAKSFERVLPTIRSRCERIRVFPMSQEEIGRYVQDDLAKILGRGYIGKTLELAKNEELKQISNFAVSIFAELKGSKQVLKFSKRFLELKDNLDLILEVLTLCIEDILKIKCESENLCRLVPFKEALKDIEQEHSVEALCEISKLISNLREKIEFNANLTIAIDNFLLKILEVKYLCK